MKWLGNFEDSVNVFGNVYVGEGVLIAGPCDINGNESRLEIGDGCDIGAFTAIACADSSDRCLGLSTEIKRAPITIGHHTFIGSHCLIKGGVTIGHHCKVAGGTVVDPGTYPDYSLIYCGTRLQLVACGEYYESQQVRCTFFRDGYYRERCEAAK